MSDSNAPWDRPASKRASHDRLSPKTKAVAKARAARAGRRYPNFVDNMAAAKKMSGKATLQSSGRKGGTARKDPRGGLTQKGRDWYRREHGAHLRAGVKKPRSEMTAQEMRRKGSWAVRFYGRKGVLPQLQKKDGTPTRFALTARAWGEPVPKTAVAARRIAAKGRRLLDAYVRATSAAN